LRNEVEARDPARLDEATMRATKAIAERFGTGAVDGRVRAFVATARACWGWMGSNLSPGSLGEHSTREAAMQKCEQLVKADVQLFMEEWQRYLAAKATQKYGGP
jgi:hypothetical protein